MMASLVAPAQHDYDGGGVLVQLQLRPGRVQRRFPILARYPCTHAVPVTTRFFVRLFPLGMCVISGCIECWPGGQGAD